MFAEVKEMLQNPVSGDDYDQQIILNINACALDLERTAEIVIPGDINITRNSTTGVVTDTSTVTDALVILAIATWCSMNIGNPANYDQLHSAYESLKGRLRLSKSYTSGVTTE